MTQTPTITNIPEQLVGESDKDYYKRIRAWLDGEDIRTKTDLKDWTGSLPFRLNVERD